MKWDPAIHIGTSGFTYKHWNPDKLPQSKWLEFFAERFSITEINSSFYHLPRPETTRDWGKRVPAGFLFCPKMSRYLTHMKKLNDPEASLELFFDVFKPLKKKMGPVLIQLPASVAFHREKTLHLYKVLKKKYSYYRFALEVRHKSWFSKESIDLMKQFNIAFVISQSGSVFPYAELVTARHVYVRFHGPAALYASGYSMEDLRCFAKLFLKWKKQGHSVWAFFNNDIHGFALKNAESLVKLVAGSNAGKKKG